MDETPPVTRAWLGKTFPIIAPISMTLLPTRVWTQGQWERIKRGYRARDMDEKWNVFVEDRAAFLHRSWTGHGMFEASFSPVDGGWHISAAIAESDSKRVRSVSAQLNQVLLELVLNAIVLGEPAADLRAELVRLTLPQDRPPPPEEAIEHSILGLRSAPDASSSGQSGFGARPARTRHVEYQAQINATNSEATQLVVAVIFLDFYCPTRYAHGLRPPLTGTRPTRWASTPPSGNHEGEMTQEHPMSNWLSGLGGRWRKAVHDFKEQLQMPGPHIDLGGAEPVLIRNDRSRPLADVTLEAGAQQ